LDLPSDAIFYSRDEVKLSKNFSSQCPHCLLIESVPDSVSGLNNALIRLSFLFTHKRH